MCSRGENWISAKFTVQSRVKNISSYSCSAAVGFYIRKQWKIKLFLATDRPTELNWRRRRSQEMKRKKIIACVSDLMIENAKAICLPELKKERQKLHPKSSANWNNFFREKKNCEKRKSFKKCKFADCLEFLSTWNLTLD